MPLVNAFGLHAAVYAYLCLISHKNSHWISFSFEAPNEVDELGIFWDVFILEVLSCRCPLDLMVKSTKKARFCVVINQLGNWS